MESSESVFGRLCTPVQVVVNLMETRDWYIGCGLSGGCALRRENNQDEQRIGKSVHRISPSMMGDRSIANRAADDEPQGRCVAANDVGFRVDRQETERLGRLTGTWVVRINGQWFEPAASLRSRPLGTR
jgi:hypothetical protein